MSLDIFFRFLNFFLLFGAGLYLAIKKVIPALKKSMHEKRARKKKLLEEKEALKNKQEKVIQDQEEQQQLCRELKEKINLWKRSWEKTELEHQKSFASTSKELKKKREIQSQHYEILAQFEKIKDDVASRTEHKLKEIYQNEAAQEEYTKKAVEALEVNS